MKGGEQILKQKMCVKNLKSKTGYKKFVWVGGGEEEEVVKNSKSEIWWEKVGVGGENFTFYLFFFVL